MPASMLLESRPLGGILQPIWPTGILPFGYPRLPSGYPHVRQPHVRGALLRIIAAGRGAVGSEDQQRSLI